jgi:hypothetical protein
MFCFPELLVLKLVIFKFKFLFQFISPWVILNSVDFCLLTFKDIFYNFIRFYNQIKNNGIDF